MNQSNQACIDQLTEIPPELRCRLTPVKDKAPRRPNWQSEPPSDEASLSKALREGEWLTNKQGKSYPQTYTGYGLKTGGGWIAIDVDGHFASEKLLELSGANLPETVSWTSGKPECMQWLYQLPAEVAKILDAAGFTRQYIDCENGQQLDFRYNQCQSVLPPSKHPETGQYEWISSFRDRHVAPAPAWLRELLVEYGLQRLQANSQTPIKQADSTAPPASPKPQKRRGVPAFLSTALPPEQQIWGNRPAPGSILERQGLLKQWNRLQMTGPGQTNDVMMALTRLLKDAGLSCEEAIQAHRYFGPQIPGFVQYASPSSRADLEESNWSDRLVTNWYRKKALNIGIGKCGPNLNQIRQDSATKRILEAVERCKIQFIETAKARIAAIQAYTKRIFGVVVHSTTLYKRKELWNPTYLPYIPPTPPPTVDLRPGIGTPLKTKASRAFLYPCSATIDHGHPSEEPRPESKTQQQTTISSLPSDKPWSFKKGDLVIVNDGSHLPYCGKPLTIVRAYVEDGIPVYQLNMSYQGTFYPANTKKRKNLVEVLGTFLQPAPLTLKPRPNIQHKKPRKAVCMRQRQQGASNPSLVVRCQAGTGLAPEQLDLLA